MLCDRERLGLALEAELVCALAVVEALRRQAVARCADASACAPCARELASRLSPVNHKLSARAE